jgi:hypothetical protein
MLNSLALASCIVMIVGCSSVKPTQKQSATTVPPSVQNQPCVTHNSIMKRFFRGWLEGNAPPPDVTEEDKTGIAACAGLAYDASMMGLLIADIAHK